MAELLPCPFCGKTPIIEHETVEPCRNRENGDLITRWKVRCFNCGTEKSGGITEYYFCADETLKIVNAKFDGRKEAIKAWNTRTPKEREVSENDI